ncbi:MAG: SUMF1/EgtB/PvdO family nonheme iron enzyme [Pseudohongiella sp.]|nr:SUMF1/EgtB/PvdO family nonheme iron enzyme [Pseudohongiella sp.]MDP2128480.1 SUMF1/EgtB/PvdO family nonheme iron enzyme [Pseudohongiella sp.]
MPRVPVLTIVAAPFFTSSAIAQIEPEMVQVPAGCAEIGTLLMGDNANPLRKVCLDGFLMSRTTITFAEYDVFTRETGRVARHDVGFGRRDRPVIDVNWFDAFDYANWLSDKTGKKYRLPTDAEWEYAAKFGTEFGFHYSWGTGPGQNRANCRNCGSAWDGVKTAPVASFEPNALGLYDLHGNVWQWTADCFYGDSDKNVNGIHCSVGVVRGGSWDVDASQLVFWTRTAQLSVRPARDIGFRLVMEQNF